MVIKKDHSALRMGKTVTAGQALGDCIRVTERSFLRFLILNLWWKEYFVFKSDVLTWRTLASVE